MMHDLLFDNEICNAIQKMKNSYKHFITIL